MSRLAIFASTVGYLGYLPFAPGTIGSVAGLLLYALVRLSSSSVIEVATILLLFALGAWSGGVAERHFRCFDPGPVVIDEVMGMLITLAFLPVGWSGAAAGFVLFRIFDIIKPFPAARLERLGGGLGVMADDAMAALYANVALRLLLAAAPRWVA